MRLLRLLCVAVVLGLAMMPAIVPPPAYAADGDPKVPRDKGDDK
jgi:hypothetical protein